MELIVIGATGRLAQTVLKCVSKEVDVIGVTRGDFLQNRGIDLARQLLSRLGSHDNLYVVDGSVDYKSEQHYQKHELEKQSLFEALSTLNSNVGYVGFSSGASQFSDEDILTPFHRLYANTKRAQKNLYQSIFKKCFFPDIFVLIGPITYRVQGAAWATILQNALEGRPVKLSDRFGKRSWVSETSVQACITQFFSTGKLCLNALVDGQFSLDDVLEFASGSKGCHLVVERIDMSNWLSVPYLAKTKSSYNDHIGRVNINTILNECMYA